MYRFEIQHLLLNPLWGFDHQQVNPFKHLKDAAHRWTLGGLSCLVGYTLPPLLQGGAQLVLRQGIDQERQPHHQRHNALRTLQEQTVGEELGVFEETKPPFRPYPLPFVGQKHLLRRQTLFIQFIGRQDELAQPSFGLGDRLGSLHHFPLQAPPHPLGNRSRARTASLAIVGHRPVSHFRLVIDPLLCQPSHGLLCSLPEGNSCRTKLFQACSASSRSWLTRFCRLARSRLSACSDQTISQRWRTPP
jgi:hypothetical protein